MGWEDIRQAQEGRSHYVTQHQRRTIGRRTSGSRTMVRKALGLLDKREKTSMQRVIGEQFGVGCADAVGARSYTCTLSCERVSVGFIQLR